jgi:hypothetical protein
LAAVFSDTKVYTACSRLVKIDPTIEFVDIFLSIGQEPIDFLTGKTALQAFRDFFIRAVILKPFIGLVGVALRDIGNRIGKKVTKSWATGSALNENTSIPFVDNSRKNINHYIRSKMFNLDALLLQKSLIVGRALGMAFKEMEKDGVVFLSSMEKSIAFKKEKIKRYQILHAQELFTSGDRIPVLDGRREFLQGLSWVVKELVDLNAGLSNFKRDIVPLEAKFSKMNLKDTSSATRQGAITKEVERV